MAEGKVGMVPVVDCSGRQSQTAVRTVSPQTHQWHASAPGSQVDGESARFCLHLCEQKRFRSSERKPNLNYQHREAQLCNQHPALSQFTDQEFFE